MIASTWTLLYSVLVVTILCAGVGAATLEVCPLGCAYSSVSSALTAANDGDIVHVKRGVYPNEGTASPTINATVAITMRAEVGSVVTLSLDPPNTNWLTVHGILTLEGDLTLILNSGPYYATGILVDGNGQVVQKGTLTLTGGAGKYVGYGVQVVGAWHQLGNFTATSSLTSTVNAFVNLHQGLWIQKPDAIMTMTLYESTGVAFDAFGFWYQQGNTRMQVGKNSNGIACLVAPNRFWAQHGRVDMVTSDFGTGIALNTGTWKSMGDINIRVLDRGSVTQYGISCYNPTVDITGNVRVAQGNACYTIKDPHRCTLSPTPC